MINQKDSRETEPAVLGTALPCQYLQVDEQSCWLTLVSRTLIITAKEGFPLGKYNIYIYISLYSMICFLGKGSISWKL